MTKVWLRRKKRNYKRGMQYLAYLYNNAKMAGAYEPLTTGRQTGKPDIAERGTK